MFFCIAPTKQKRRSLVFPSLAVIFPPKFFSFSLCKKDQYPTLGVDARLVVEKGITPVINTGIAHKVAGFGQIGAGTVRPPLACFEKAVLAYARKLGFNE
ncbi:hypothetical protein FEA23_10230 [Mannheimia haemolytica]|uniref:hypothetical protein n=1 Tax=Mannheimia haemolytica TaxID=75985 RepID=UPI00115E2F85|nr:hypothetical protein [Mannheimia haemolytica]TRC15679.1 hypothetical protein FEA23_10230 [Mannheimia haemolytica]